MPGLVAATEKADKDLIVLLSGAIRANKRTKTTKAQTKSRPVDRNNDMAAL